MVSRVVLLSLRKDFRNVVGSPIAVLNMTALNPLYRLILPSYLLATAFLYHGRAVGLAQSTGSVDFQGFIFVGAFMNILMVGAIIGTSAVIGFERGSGTLEQAWTTPSSRVATAVPFAVSALALSAIGAFTCLLLGVAAFGVRLRWTTVFAIPAVLIGVAGMVGVCYLVMALLLRMGQARAVLDGGGFFLGLLSGNIFPVTVLPGPLRVISSALPSTYAIDLLRHFALGSWPLLSVRWEYPLEAVCSAGLLGLGVFAFVRAERFVSTTGRLGQF
ncbi:ABC transporter permease [Catenulispora pinisilvae]|uniref:ABC transporter permease n=1 Tax=Catenulispora pinisilvae TaxID=2705253 RepID=UPI001891B6EE|nr:ABC transporter permease [Catenulispora pinisilvae]